MPKDRRVNSSSFDHRAMVSPYSRSPKISSLIAGDEKEWEEARCPICMEHPHNAVLLLCSSSENGCRPFICDTSYRHSNCLDQLRKSADSCELVCPLCRGLVTGWKVINPARKFMNSKTRNCSLETCGYNGNYTELRKHARLDHPSKRPSEASPNRQLNWEALERQREMEDALAHQSDFDDDFDEWFNLHQLGDDAWSDESFFDFSDIEIDNESVDEMEMDMFSFAMSLFSIYPSSPDDSNLRSDNHRVGYMSHTSRPVSRNHSEEGGLSRYREVDLDFRPRRPSYQMGNGSTNLRSMSNSHRENVRSSYPRENGSTASGSRSSNSRQNGSSNFRRDVGPSSSSSSRARTSFHPRDEGYSRSNVRGPSSRMPRSGHERRRG